MKRKPINSTALKSVGFDSKARVLEVEFRSGNVYQYADVSAAKARGLTRSKSPGNYMAKNIMGNFKARRLDE